MSALTSFSSRPRLRAAAAVILLFAALALVLLTAAPEAAAILAVLTLGVALSTALAARPTRMRNRTVRQADVGAAAAGPTLRLTLADGDVVSARPVALPGQSEHQLLLTRDGYVVVDAEGRVLHRLQG